MTVVIEPVPSDTIAATNVRPAFEASLLFGATEAELEAIGLTRVGLSEDDATVPAATTYAHMELMFAKPRYAEFVVAAAAAHTVRSLGVLGLACKTVATLGEAMLCHQRFQHLTNRTASYEAVLERGCIEIRETRFGPPRAGSLLISDYTMLVAVQLLRISAAVEVAPLRMRSRREEIDAAEKTAYERFIGAPVEVGSPLASLAYPAELAQVPVATADAELSSYFQELLRTAGDFDEPELLRTLRLAIRDGLMRGTPTAAEIARGQGIGARTLARRLADHGLTFAELLESTRRTLADRYLADPKLTLAEVAYLLGYREQSSFHRAFRRWHGKTPAAYRGDAG